MNKLLFIVVIFAVFNNYLSANNMEDERIKKEKTFVNEDIKKILKNILEKEYQSLLINKSILKDYYKQNDFNTYWVEEEKGLKDIALSLIEKIKNDPVLKPKVNNIFKLDEITGKINSIDKSKKEDLFTADFMLTELYDKYMFYLLQGSINWKLFEEKLSLIEKETEIKSHWDRYSLIKNPKLLLKKAIEEDTLTNVFKEVDFNYPNAEKLISAIDSLEKISQNGGYTKLPEIKSLRLGDSSDVVKVLRARLAQSQDLTKICEGSVVVQNIVTNTTAPLSTQTENPSNENLATLETQTSEETIPCENYFDEDLKTAVISFQKNHGLYADGIVGSWTQKFLNTSAEEKIEQIRLNLERMRWLPRDLGEKYLLVNIPEFRLRMVENDAIKLSMNVVVGEKKHPTPIFSDKMSYVVLNPTWNIPHSITKKEIIPKLIKDPNYLASKGIDIYESWNPDSEKMNTKDIIDAFILEDVSSMPNFRITQSPSSENPLGRMKFMFPNKHAVYFHDTPAKSLFGNARRAYSHGCIRLAKPNELLSAIAQEDKSLNPERIDSILKNESEKALGLSKKIPVHIVYLTSWVDEEGQLQFREDIYNYDSIQKKLLY